MLIIGRLALLLMVCAGCNNTQTTSGIQQDNFRFIVAADPQLFRGKKETLDKAIESINGFKPKFVIVCGDLIETPSNPPQIQAYKEAVSKLSPKTALYNLSGNHDIGRPVEMKYVSAYQENFGPLWYHFTYNNSVFVVLSSDILQDSNAPMNKEQTEWLAGILEQFQSKTINNIFIFMHHPLYLNSPDEPDGYSNVPSPIRQTLLELFVKYRIRAVFSGHLHDNKINRYQGVDLITTNSMTVPLGKAPAGFHIIEVNHNGYENRYYAIKQESIK